MSAESPLRSSETRSVGPCVITPQQVNDPSILDNVAGFINGVVPSAYNLPQESKDQIQWAHFEQIESEEATTSSDFDGDKELPPPLVLVLGYSNGIQVWGLPANGEATEIFSWRRGSVRVMKVLPNPFEIGHSETEDQFHAKRPLIALCEGANPGSQFCSVNFVSLKTGDQVKVIKFKNPVLGIFANRKSVVVTFAERIAVFDAFTLEDRLGVATCYLSPGLQQNPIALGSRWMAYAEKKLNQSKRSSGGNEGEGLQSYTATVLHAAKSLGRGLRELGESVASSLTGSQSYKPGTSPNSPQSGTNADIPQKGIVSIIDIESTNHTDKTGFPGAVIAHFIAHTEAIVCMEFDPSGLLLLTADKRGHDFHLFRIHPHPAGPALAAVHHLYVLHRGDTTARVQDMCFSPDSRWVAVSTLRGTTHVFPITPYGGNVSVRTHATPHVVNKMSRFHRSAGLTAEGRSNSPVSLIDLPTCSNYPYNNPRFPPYPHPTIISPLAQIRQPLYTPSLLNVPQRSGSGRQRIPSSSEENVSLRLTTCFAPPRAWIDNAPAREPGPIKIQAKPVESLFVMSCNGCLVQYDLDPHHSASIPKERVCDDSPIDLTVTARAQWILQRQPGHVDIPLPVSPENLAFVAQEPQWFKSSKPDHTDESWLSQVEIVTHAGPHRRLWMGPQFTFKTYTTSNGSELSMASMAEALPIDLRRSKPVNMPITKANAVLIESSSANSCEQSLLDNYQRTYEEPGGQCEIQLREDLAEAMQESPFVKETGGRCVIVSMKPHTSATVAKVVNPLGTVVTVQSDEEAEVVDVSDDVVILENCDEALFRPVVTPKPLHYTERPRTHSPDKIITKNLESNTEVTVKILTKKDKLADAPKPIKKPRSRESSPKAPVSKKAEKHTSNKINKELRQNVVKTEETVELPRAEAKAKVETKPKEEIRPPKPDFKPKLDAKFISDFSDPLELPDTPNEVKPSEELFDIPMPKPLDCNLFDDIILDTMMNLDTKLPQQEKSSDDVFEDIVESASFKNNKESRSKREEKVEVMTMDDSVSEERSFSKKPRKPKAKLGVKIATVNKENIEKTLDDCTTDITLAPPPKRSWSSIASSKPAESDKVLIDTTEKEKNLDFVEHFSVTLPQKSYSSSVTNDDLINIDTPQEEQVETSESMNNSANSDDNLLKIDKSSDDEKPDTGSSPNETTESDDSGKLQPENDPNADDDVAVLKSNAPMSKASKRKLKKKRK